MTRRSNPLPVLALAFACLMLSAPSARSQARADVGASPFSPAPYRVGERLSYNISFSNFPTAAHAELLVASRGQHFGREGVELRAHVETIGIVSAALYAINNDYAAFVDPSTGMPYSLRRTIREGSLSAGFATNPNQPSGVTAPPAGRVSTPAPGTLDFLSAIYRLRALPLAQGATYYVTIQNDAAPYEIELKVMGRELLKTNVGSSNAIATQVRVHANRAANDYRVRIYFTDDELHVPVLLTARHPAGEIRAELAAVEIMTEVPATATVEPGPLTANPQGRPPGAVIPLPPSTGLPAVAPTPRATTPPTAAGGAPAPVDPPADLPFKVGEQLNFNFYAGASAQVIGTATFHVRARQKYFNHDGFLLTAQMQTAGAAQTAFPVRDQLNSYVDTGTLLPFRTELRIQEGKRLANWVVSVDQDRGNALFDDGTRVGMPVGTHDLLSVFYALRSFDLTPGRQNRVSLIINKRPRLLSVTALRRDNLDLGGQRIPAVELSLVTNDPEGDRFTLRLWVSTDKRRLPLRLTAQTPLGPVRADLAIIPVSLQ